MTLIKQANARFEKAIRMAETNNLVDAIAFATQGCEFLRLEHREKAAASLPNN